MKLEEQNKTGGELRLERRELLDKTHLKLSDEENKRLLELDDLIDQLPANENAENRKMLEQISKMYSMLNGQSNSEIDVAIRLVNTIINSATTLNGMMSKSLKEAVDEHNKSTKNGELKIPHLETNKKLQKAILKFYENPAIISLFVLGAKYKGIKIKI